ncbi:MAG: DNA-directed RNA polymerase subunit omega [Candidatus Schekmanbacteria bacterium]|nr:MAG: DNA-directed RNA polymerase subunit omega [Candidatus Schekmanbacteria bacterium]
MKDGNLEEVLNQAIEKIPNKYELVCIAAKRANQITSGYTPLVESKFVKPASIALLEIAKDKVKIETGEE